jgi:RNA polymerase sigma factor (sigma-70 family)
VAVEQNISDREIIAGLQQGGRRERQCLKQLYQAHQRPVLQFIMNNSGSEAEGKDIFQEGLLVLYKQIREGKFRGESQLRTYLFSICKYLWFQKLKKENRRAELQENYEWDPQEIDPYRAMQDEEQKKMVLALFEELGQACKKILLASLYDNKSMEEIARESGFKNEQIARNKKYKCLKRLQAMLDKQPGLRDALRELR